MPEHRIYFLPGKQAGAFEEGTTIRDAALELGIVIESTCAGIGTCGKCKVIVNEGVTAPTAVEEELLSPKDLARGARLSCQSRLMNDTVCVVPPESRSFGDQIMTEGGKGHFTLQPDIRKILVHIPPPVLGSKHFDREALLAALSIVAGIETPLGCDLAIARELPALLRANDYCVTAVVDDARVLTVEGGDTVSLLFGVAFDIGTTTVVAKLIDLTTGAIVAVASSMNPQRTYGADVVSRINYTVEHPGGLELMHRLIVKEMNALIARLCAASAVPAAQIYKAVFVGNTVMQHLVLKIDPRNIAFAPYAPAFQGPATIDAADIGLAINPFGSLYVPANLACFVGSDITAVLTVLDLEEAGTCRLVVDIGTNGEMVLSRNGRLLCSSSPAGPAWEGAYIQWGMRAARGAIERAEIVDGRLQFRTIGGADAVGICGSGLLDLVSEFARAGVIDKTGRILDAELIPNVPDEVRGRLLRRESGANDIVIHPIDGDQSILLTQKDIREVQLAKAAIVTGTKILMKELGVGTDEIESVYIAGAFGNHVRGEDAVAIGLIPGVPVERVKFIGNAAMAGSEAILLSREARLRSESLARSVGYVEVSGRADFQDLFVDSIHFPLNG